MSALTIKFCIKFNCNNKTVNTRYEYHKKTASNQQIEEIY